MTTIQAVAPDFTFLKCGKIREKISIKFSNKSGQILSEAGQSETNFLFVILLCSHLLTKRGR